MTDIAAPRVIGTGYEGKEPFRFTTDVLREVTRRAPTSSGFDYRRLIFGDGDLPSRNLSRGHRVLRA